ncbi:hypothetical protein FGIG_07601 [Fasciola gigantica]|uniref:Uncharacterized protein n=1 Tax=Fasciola gigantica TaxID=46835 RepID=A0A504YQE5_FASGI|nr:hypothetical protein FGIG_07601 [Fasciola gigantica]
MVHQLNCFPNLNGLRKISATLRHLDQSSDLPWSGVASFIKRLGRETTLMDLIEFVDEMADVPLLHRSYSPNSGATQRLIRCDRGIPLNILTPHNQAIAVHQDPRPFRLSRWCLQYEEAH